MTQFRIPAPALCLRLIVCLLMFASGALVPVGTGAVAQQVKGTEPPPALRDVRRSDLSSCEVKPRTGVAGAEARQGIRPDYSCSIQPAEALDWIKSRRASVIDTRPPDEYARYRIDGSINVEPRGLVNRKHLMSRPLVLTDDGAADSEVYANCAYLRSRGFKDVRVLQGGLHAWNLAQLPLVGDVPSVSRVQLIDEPSVFRRHGAADTLVLVSPKLFGLIDVLPRAHLLPDETDASLLRAVAERRRAGGPLNAVVLVGPAGRIDALAAQLAPLRLLAYEGTQASMQRYSATLATVWKRQADGPSQVSCLAL